MFGSRDKLTKTKLINHVLKQSHVLTIDKKGNSALSKIISFTFKSNQLLLSLRYHSMAILEALKKNTIDYKKKKKKEYSQYERLLLLYLCGAGVGFGVGFGLRLLLRLRHHPSTSF